MIYGLILISLLLWRISYQLRKVLKEMQYRNELLGHQCRWLEETIHKICKLKN